MKQGQIAIFLLIAVILLVSISLYYLYRNDFALTQRAIDPTFLPVRNLVENCLATIGEDGVNLLGLHGGYLVLPSQLENNPSASIALDPNGEFRTPLWVFRGESFVPTKEGMEQDLTTYINDRLNECADFSSIASQFTVKKKSAPRVRVTIAASDVEIFLEQDFDVTQKATQKVIEIDSFQTLLQVKLGQIYSSAVNLLRSEKEGLFLENATLNLFTANPAIPFTDLRVDCTPQSWDVQTVKDEMLSTLAANIPRIRIKGAPHVPFERPIAEYLDATSYDMDDIFEGKYPKYAPPDLYEYTHLYWDPQVGDIPFEAKVLYDAKWGMDLDAQPSRNGRLRTTKIPMSSKFLDFFCLNLHHFTYSIQYPVIIKLMQPDAFAGRGFSFEYGTTVIIKENKPSREPVEINPFVGATYDRDFCNDVGDTSATIQARGIKDGYLNVVLNDVNVSMRCVRSLCPLGLTHATGSGTYLSVSLPQGCQNPTFIGKKAGYLPGESQDDDNDGFTLLDLVALHKLEVKPIVWPYQSVGNSFSNTQLMDEDMRLIVRMSSPKHDISLVYPKQDRLPVYVDLALEDSAYDIYAVLFRGDQAIGGYQGQLHIDLGKAIDAQVLTLPIIEYRPTPISDEDKTAMLKYIATGNYQEVAKVELQ